MNNFCKNLIAYVFIGFFSFKGFGQDQRKADSLINVLSNGHHSDSVKLTLIAEIAFHSNSPDQIIKYGTKALTISKALNQEMKIAQSHVHLGDGHRLKGNLTLAISNYLKAAEFYNAVGEIIGVSTVYSNLGNVYLTEGNYENSRRYFNKAIDIFRQEKDTLKLASTLMNAGELFRSSGELDLARNAFKESGEIFDKMDYSLGTAYNLGNIGLVYAQQGKPELAEENMNKAIAILERFGDHYPIAVYQTSLADIYVERGEFNRALEYAENSLAIGIEEGLKEQIRDASLKLSELYKVVGNSDQAYTHLKQYVVYRDSINNEETIRKMADLRTEYEVAKKQTEVDLLTDQARLNRIVSWSAVFIIALLLVLTLALLKIYRIKDRAVRIVRKRRRVIAAQRNQLDQVNKTKDRFFSIISHDIRGPVSNFQGISGLINIMAESKDTKGLKQLGTMMETSAREVSVLLDNLLEWALSQEGKIPYHPEQIDLNELCQSNLNIMANLAAAKKIKLEAEKGQEFFIEADRNSVSTIIRNLLSNAIKFTPEGGLVNLDIRREDDHGVIIVKDSGIGIPQEKIEDLFSFKGIRSQGGTKGEKGIGLGLSLVHEFVGLNHGRTEVASEEGKGTTFKVYLPLFINKNRVQSAPSSET
ncbi:MAG: tetratricopeptide repeat-containing sensor histidine kinase [Reichenbachiella sp.]|uniref:tetratricopeptide repeat-containing sensor histidine kinase n=1 Tax=Reichenbachiella sp. TaxID=2184521 RepID=UPI003266C69E